MRNQYQSKRVTCGSTFKLANLLLAEHGFNRALRICEKNHWDGIMNDLKSLKAAR
jgi:hypothetical protein